MKEPVMHACPLLHTWRRLLAALTLAMLGLALAPARAAEAQPSAADPQLEARVMALAAELRCLVCQNQTIADSHAALAVDLREELRRMLARGDSEAQVIEFMTARYGDFVLYRPPVTRSTWLLWFGPAALLLLALGGLALHLRRRQALNDAHFDEDEPDLDETPLPEAKP